MCVELVSGKKIANLNDQTNKREWPGAVEITTST
jgi:hypothetical protein